MNKYLALFILYIIYIHSAKAQILPDTTLAHSYFNKADSLFTYVGDYDASIKYYKKAAPIYKKTEMWQKHFRCRNMVARVLQQQGNEMLSSKLVKNIIKESISKLDSNNSEEAYAYYIIARIYNWEKANNVKSLFYINKAIKIQYKLGLNFQLDLAKSYRALGSIYNGFMLYDKSIVCFNKALEIYNNNPKKDQRRIAMNFNNISRAYLKLASYDLALEYARKALKLQSKYLDSYHPDLILTKQKISAIYFFKNDYKNALLFYPKLINKTNQLTNKELIINSDIYESVGIIYKNMKLYDMAFKNLNKSLEIRKMLKGENSIQVGDIYGTLGNLYLDLNSFQKAEFYLKKEINISRRLLGAKNSYLSFGYYNLAKISIIKKQYLNALERIQRALYSNVKDFKDSINIYENPSVGFYFNRDYLLESLQLKAQTLSKLNTPKNLEFSLETYNLIDKFIDKIRDSHQLQSDKIRVGKTAQQIYNEALSLSLKLANTHSGKKKQEYLEKAFYFSEKSKSIVLYNSITENSAKQFSGIPDSLLAKEKELKINRNYYQQRLLGDLDSLKKLEYQDQLFNINRSYDALIASFEKDYPKYYQLKHNNKIAAIQEIQDKLEPKTSLVEYFIGDSSLFTFVVSKNQFIYKEIPLQDSLSTQVQQFNQYLQDKNKPAFTQTAQKLHHLLITPIADIIEGQKLVIIPDGPLWYLSFDMLITKPSLSNEFHKQAYLIEKYPISYGYSANLLLEEKSRKLRNKKLECLAFSYSNFDDQVEGETVTLRDFRKAALRDLPGSRKEIAAVSQIMDGTYYYGSQANEKNFKSHAQEYAVLHLALHGTVDEKEPLNSKLYFTQVSDSLEDNYLHAYELYNMSLNSEMVVLSACNTGSGKLEKGEGVMSLGRAFTYAGCKSMVISQWKLSDYSTPIIMQYFYKHLDDGLPKDEALRSAKLDYLKEADNLTSNPYFWAGLVQLGDNAPLPQNNKALYISIALVLAICGLGYLVVKR